MIHRGICLRFSNAGRGNGLGSCQLENKKLGLWVRSWSLTPSYNIDLEPLGRCNNELFKKSKSSRSQIIFEISSIKNFPIFTGKHLFRGLFLHTCNIFIYKETPTQVSPVDIVNFLRADFFIENPQWLLLTVLPQYSEIS